jgi:type I restriction enzyme S subunit
MTTSELSCPITTKPKGIPPTGWSWVPLAEVARLESGHTPSRRVASYWNDGDILWLSLKDIRGLSSKYVIETADRPTMLGIENSSARILPQGTVALCRTASVGNVVILGRDMATSQDFVNWVCGPRLLPEYLYWAFRSSEATFDLEKQGSTHQTIYMPVVARFQVLLPPLDEQRRIADVLDRADALRAKRRAALAKLDVLAEAVFLDLFGDPLANTKGWPADRRLGEVAEIASGVTKGRKLNGKPTREIPYLAVVNVQDRSLNLSTLKTIEATEDEIQRYRLIQDDLLLTEGGDPDKLGRGTLWKGELPECIHQNHIFRVRLISRDINPVFLNWLVGSTRGKSYFLKSAKQTTGIASINMTQLRGFPILLPPIELQREFAQRIALVERMKEVQRASLAKLDKLFASLQHGAFRGELFQTDSHAEPLQLSISGL